jgi:hypothetical protein
MDRKILLTFNTKFPLYKGRVTTLKIGHDRVLDSKIWDKINNINKFLYL